MKKKNNPKTKNNQNKHHQLPHTIVVTKNFVNRGCIAEYWSWEVILPSGYQHALAGDTGVPNKLLNMIEKWFVLALLGCAISLLKANFYAALRISSASWAGRGLSGTHWVLGWWLQHSSAIIMCTDTALTEILQQKQTSKLSCTSSCWDVDVIVCLWIT